MNQALLEEKLKATVATKIRSKGELLDSHQELYVKESMAHKRTAAGAKRAKISNGMLQPQVSALIDAKNVLKKELTRARQELEDNKQTLLLVEKLKTKLKESLVTNQNLEELTLLAEERAVVAQKEA